MGVDMASIERNRYRNQILIFTGRALLCLGACGVLPAAQARAGNIFEEDWTPPAPRKPIQRPAENGTTKPVVPPKPPIDSTPPATPPATPPVETRTAPQPEVVARHSVPAKDDQARSRKLFKELFAKDLADRSAAARRALAVKLLAEAVKMTDAPTDQFVLLMAASDAGTEAADLRVCVRAANTLSSSYDVDGPRLAADAALRMNLRAGTPAAAAENCRAGLELVDELIDSDEYSSAARLLSALRPIASGDAALRGLVQSREKDLDAIRSTAERLARQFDKLKNQPDDPAANLAVGRFLCLMKGDWDRGSIMLARGSDPVLKALALKDLGMPDGEAAYELGDELWNLSEKEPLALSRTRLRARAVLWFKRALPRLAGLSKSLAEKRIAEAASESAASTGMIDLLPSMEGTRKVRNDDGTVLLSRGGRITTPGNFRPPVTFRIVVMTSEKDLRLGFAARQIIFNWEMNHDDLRVDGGPPNGKHKPGAGRLPSEQWVTIEFVVNPDELVLSVDGVERHRVKANYTKIDEPLSITAQNGEVKIKSAGVTQSSNQ